MIDLLLILALLVANGLLAMSEMAVVAARKVRLEARAETGSGGAKAALRLARNPGRFLSTVQTGVSLIGILLGALSDTAIAAPIAVALRQVSWLSPSVAGALAFALGVAITTFVSLIVGELVPKQIALRRAEPVAVAVAPALSVIAKIFLPAVLLLDYTTRGVLAVLGLNRVQTETVSEAEVRTLIEEGMEHGVFHPSEGVMVGRVLRFADRTVRTIMTPRAEMVWIDIDADRAEVARIIAESGHTRLPVGRGSDDDIVGLVHVRDLLSQCLQDRPMVVRDLVHPMPAIYELTDVLQSLEILRKAGIRMGLIVDEYGAVQGIITLEDVLEAIVGDLPEIGREDEVEIVTQPDGSLIVDGLLAIEDLKPRLGLQSLPGEDEVSTVNGFMLHRLGRLPRVGDRVQYASYGFEVLSMDGRRVGKLRICGSDELDEDGGG